MYNVIKPNGEKLTAPWEGRFTCRDEALRYAWLSDSTPRSLDDWKRGYTKRGWKVVKEGGMTEKEEQPINTPKCYRSELDDALQGFYKSIEAEILRLMRLIWRLK